MPMIASINHNQTKSMMIVFSRIYHDVKSQERDSTSKTLGEKFRKDRLLHWISFV